MDKKKHVLAGKTVILITKPDPDELNGKEFHVEDWWINVSGKSWTISRGNPACLKYAIRSSFCGLPVDEDVVYGKVGGFGHLIHQSEIGEIVE
jgi:hypothetical protein